VAKVWLEADMEKSGEGENLVDNSVAHRIIKTRCKKKILNDLQKLHGEKEKDATGKFDVVSSGVHPPIAMKKMSASSNRDHQAYQVEKRPMAANPADISPVKHISQVARLIFVTKCAIDNGRFCCFTEPFIATQPHIIDES
jgi:hypothetical protein